ncbi:hypothetical protein OJ996_15460 [Luteolibacter sp. GHJ8]|uniref:Uncharacterized protein n=1 Tax=Luteolibacter rhizosphaerae TaxID=2989719 RepID=A0ABT3G589_9BACT|nr:hypothetical protein [Luteolibacter rhizosphaerae]MCW1914985.1 hypothetical protein [Luteolibacter rhizosphaerae]
MKNNGFSEVIASAQLRASEREAGKAAQRESLGEAIRSKHEVLHGVVHRTLLEAWRGLEAAGVKATVNTDANPRGEWQISLKLLEKPEAPRLVFSVITGLAAHLVCSREGAGAQGELDYQMLDDATPAEIARIVADYLAEVLG